MMSGRRIVLGVTSDISLTLMRGFPGYLAGRGWDVHVVSAPGPLLDEVATVPGVTTHGIPMEREPSLRADLRSLLAWRQLLKQLKPDVTSVGTPKAGLLGGLAARWAGVPNRFYLLRGLRLETTGGLKRAILNFMERVAVASSHRVLAVSPSLRDLVVSLRLVHASKVAVVANGSSNGVDVDRFDPAQFSESDLSALRAKHGLRPDLPTVGYVGRLTVDKGLAVLSSAIDELADSASFQVLVVGAVEGDAELQLGSSGKVVVATTGHIVDVAPYYQLMDVLCLPTFREGFPNVVLEAGAAGRPTVTTDATGAIDSVVPGETGLIVPIGSSSALAAALARVLFGRPFAEQLGAQARDHVRATYSRPDVWAQYEQVYASSAALRGGR